MVADEVGVGAGNLALIDRDRLNPGKQLEALAHDHGRARSLRFAQRKGRGPRSLSVMIRVAIIFHPADKLENVAAAGMEGDDVILVAQFADGREDAGFWIPWILVVQDHGLPHQSFQFGNFMLAVDDVIVGIARIVWIVDQ